MAQQVRLEMTDVNAGYTDIAFSGGRQRVRDHVYDFPITEGD